MYNYFMLIGLVYKDPEKKVSKNGKTYIKIPLMVTRPFKNSNGEYDVDNFSFLLWESLAELADNVKKGTKIGVKGRIQCRYVKNEEHTLIPAHELVPERLVLFDSNSAKEAEEEQELNSENSELVPEEEEQKD